MEKNRVRDFFDLKEVEIFDAMDDLVRISDFQGNILFENKSFRDLCVKDGKSLSTSLFFPLTASQDAIESGHTEVTEVCIMGHVFSVKTSPILREGKKTQAAIEVFRDTTVQNNLTISLYGANQKIKQEMLLAKSIQTNMLPTLKQYNNLSFDSRYVPSEELSGDFYDLIPLSQNRIAIYISDVVGHGVSASILTMFVRQTMRSILKEEKIFMPKEVLGTLKERFDEINLEEQYFSLFYGVFDLTNLVFTYGNAGHNCEPILKRKDAITYLEATGMLISSDLEYKEYDQKSIQLESKDQILFFTDGLIETQNLEETPYGMNQLVYLLLYSEDNLLDRILEDVEYYRLGEQKDDIALLLVEVD